MHTVDEATCHHFVVNKLNFTDVHFRVPEKGKRHHTIRPAAHTTALGIEATSIASLRDLMRCTDLPPSSRRVAKTVLYT